MGEKGRAIKRTGQERLPPINQSPSPTSPRETKWTVGLQTHIGQHVMWGTQEMMWPVSRKIPEASERIKILSKPKKNFQADLVRPLYYYSIGRPTMIWDMKPAPEEPSCSPRLKELASPKPIHKDHQTNRALYMYSCGRPSLVSLTPSPQRGTCSPRLLELARPKQYKDYLTLQAIIQPMNISSKLKR